MSHLLYATTWLHIHYGACFDEMQPYGCYIWCALFATFITSQLRAEHLHAWSGHATMAVAILDCVMQRSHRDRKQ
jgi:hypothetical protein